MTDKHVYVIHGYTATPTDNWFPWLKRQVEEQLNIPTTILEMPNADNPKLQEWDELCDRLIDTNHELTIVGHSLGCIQALRFVSQHTIKNIKMILVSGFDEVLNTLPQLHSFTDTSLNYQTIIPKIDQAVVISALDDDIVSYHYSETLARHLKCQFILMPNGKHFIDRDHIYEVPVVCQQISLMNEYRENHFNS